MLETAAPDRLVIGDKSDEKHERRQPHLFVKTKQTRGKKTNVCHLSSGKKDSGENQNDR